MGVSSLFVVGVSGLCGRCPGADTPTSIAGFEILFNVDYYTPEVKHADSEVCMHCKSIGEGFKDHVMIT